MNTIFWHDYETSGTSPALDRPMQFAGIRTDEDLNIIGEPVTLYCKPSREILPHPEACLITGITPQLADEKGLSEPEFIATINREFMVPGTCGAGYNSIRFDDEVTRYTLYRNFFDPYEREWQGGNSRWDIIDMLRLTHALRPDGINWPKHEDGHTSFRLDQLTVANGISHQDAHDALSDVHATIAMARLVRERQPKLYQYVYQNRTKQQVAALLDLQQRKPFLHVSSRLPRETAYTALMMPIAIHPTNKNAVVCVNLSQKPELLLSLSAEQIRERLFTRTQDLPEGVERVALKSVHLNRCPVVATAKLLDAATAERLGIDIGACERHWATLKEADLAGKIGAIFSAEEEYEPRDAEAALYQGFLPNGDKPLLAKVRRAAAAELAVLQSQFSDPRYREMLFRYRGRFHPDTLSEEEHGIWEEYRYQALTEPEDNRLSLDAYFDRLQELEAEPDQSQKNLNIINALKEWGDLILAG